VIVEPLPVTAWPCEFLVTIGIELTNTRLLALVHIPVTAGPEKITTSVWMPR